MVSISFSEASNCMKSESNDIFKKYIWSYFWTTLQFRPVKYQIDRSPDMPLGKYVTNIIGCFLESNVVDPYLGHIIWICQSVSEYLLFHVMLETPDGAFPKLWVPSQYKFSWILGEHKHHKTYWVNCHKISKRHWISGI